MKTLSIGNVDYTIKYGYNSFADTDLLERVNDISQILNGAGAETDSDVSQLGKIKELFVITRELLFVGLNNKFNPNKVENITEVGDLLDTYHDECPEGEARGLLDVFSMLSMELMEEGFLADLMNQMTETDNIKSIPQDHKKKTRKPVQ